MIPFSTNDLLMGVVLPALLAGSILLVFQRILPLGFASRFSASAALVGGFELGYWLLKLGPLVPTAHWHWLVFLMLATLAVGPVLRAEGVTYFERLLLVVAAAVVTGWLLVPDWQDIEPSRNVHLCFWFIGVILFVMLFEPMTDRICGITIPLMLTLVLTSGAMLLALSGSLRFAQILLAGGGAMGGISAVSAWRGHDSSMKGIAVSCCILLLGMLLVGQVNSFSDVPVASYLLVAIAPLSAWLTGWGPMGHWSGVKGIMARVGLPALFAGFGVILAGLSG